PKPNYVEIVATPEIDVPLTYGIRRPVVILPSAMIEAGHEEVIKQCLAHEWSHIRRRDIAHWWLWQAVQPLFWFQPLYWVLRRELRLCQDQIADHFAAGQTNDTLTYAESLLHLARSRRRMQINLALTMNDGKSNLYRRVQRLVSANSHLTSVCRA